MQPLKIAFPLGIGDCHWGCQKLAGLRELHPDRPIHAYVNESVNHRTVGFLEIVEHVDVAQMSNLAPHDINSEMPPSYLADKWATQRGCECWKTFDYILVANGHVERGRSMAEFVPEVRTEWTYKLNISDADRAHERKLVPWDKPVLLYPSGTGPNGGFHNHWWTPLMWLDVIRQLQSAGHMPVIMGANTSDDLGYLQRIEIAASDACVSLRCRKIVGKTTIPQAMSLIQRAAVWVGLNSGLGIVSASQNTPTLMLWADRRFAGEMPGAHHAGFIPEMQRCWLHESQLATYRTLSFGSPDLNPANVVKNILERLDGDSNDTDAGGANDGRAHADLAPRDRDRPCPHGPG